MLKKESKYAVLYAPGQIEISPPDMTSYYPYHIDLTDTLRYDLKLPMNTFEEICRSDGIAFQIRLILFGRILFSRFISGIRGTGMKKATE